MTLLTPQEVYDLIRQGAADGGWQGFASKVQEALVKKNELLIQLIINNEQLVIPLMHKCYVKSLVLNIKTKIITENDDEKY